MYTYDDQLIDAVQVRRQRLAGALLHRDERLHRRWTDRVNTFLISAFLAALVAAACVAISFVSHLLATDPFINRNQQLRDQQAQQDVPVETPGSRAPSAGTTGSTGDAGVRGEGTR